MRAHCKPAAVAALEQEGKGQRSRANGLRVRQATTADVPNVARLCTEVRCHVLLLNCARISQKAKFKCCIKRTYFFCTLLYMHPAKAPVRQWKTVCVCVLLVSDSAKAEPSAGLCSGAKHSALMTLEQVCLASLPVFRTCSIEFQNLQHRIKVP